MSCVCRVEAATAAILNLEWWVDDLLYRPMYIWKASLCLCWTKMYCICAAADLCFTSAEWSGYSFLLSTQSRGWFAVPGFTFQEWNTW